MQQLFFRLIASAIIVATAFGQEPSNPSNANKLTPEQKNLAAFVGTWELSVEGIEKKGRAEVKSILGGRFITEDVTLPFGDFDMEWHGVMGYDESQKQYTGIWFDNANNTTRSNFGEANASGRIITYRGEQAGIGKFIWRISNDGEKSMMIEMFQLSDSGSETLIMKISGTRLNPTAVQGEK